MKKLLRFLFILVLLGLGFLYIVKNPELGISQTILKAIGLEKLYMTDTGVNTTGYLIQVPEAGITFTYPVELQSMPVGAFQEYDGAEGKVWNKPLYVGGISGQKMIEFIQQPYHVSDGIDDYTLTLEQKNSLITNGTCPREGWVCTQKKVGDYDILYMYGKDGEFGYLNMHMFILAADSFIYVQDYYLYEAIKKIGGEDTVALNQKAKELGLEDEQIMYNEQYHSFHMSLVDQKMKNLTGALLEATQYAQAFIDSMQYMTGFILSGITLTGMELTGATIGEYTVKTEKGENIPGEDIHIYDTENNEVFSLLASKAPDLQHFDKVVGNYIVVDYGTSFDRTLAIYDITTKTKIFESSYHSDGNELAIDSDSVTFDYTLTEKPQNAPTCTDQYNGYTETRVFDFTTKQMTKTGISKCAFFE